MRIMFVEDGSLDINELKKVLNGTDIYPVVYRQGTSIPILTDLTNNAEYNIERKEEVKETDKEENKDKDKDTSIDYKETEKTFTAKMSKDIGMCWDTVKVGCACCLNIPSPACEKCPYAVTDCSTKLVADLDACTSYMINHYVMDEADVDLLMSVRMLYLNNYEKSISYQKQQAYLKSLIRLYYRALRCIFPYKF